MDFGGGGGDIKPLDFQREPLSDIFKRYEMIVNARSKDGPYKGKTFADINSMQSQGVDQLNNWARGTGGQMPGALNSSGMGNLGAGMNFGGNALGIFGTYQNDPTGGILGSASRYMDDPGLQNQIDAVGRDISRNFREEDVVGANAEAMTGTAGSSRAEVARQMQLRGAQDRLADVSASMRGAARESALDRASNNYFNNANVLLDANRQVGAAGEMGAAQIGDALRYNQALAGDQLQAGGILQQAQQARYNEQQRLWDQSNGGYQRDLLKDWYGLVGGQSWGTKGGAAGGSGMGQLLGTGLTLAGTVIGGMYGGPMGAAAGGALGGAVGGAVGGGSAGAGGGAASGLQFGNSMSGYYTPSSSVGARNTAIPTYSSMAGRGV